MLARLRRWWRGPSGGEAFADGEWAALAARLPLLEGWSAEDLDRLRVLAGDFLRRKVVQGAGGLEVDDAMGGMVRAGFTYMVDDRQGLFVTVQKLFVDTTITGTVDPSIPGLGGAPASADIDLDPMIVFAGYTYRF